MIVLICYVIGYLSRMLSVDYDFLKYFSPFQLFMPENIVKNTENIIINFILYFILCAVLIITGLYKFNNRDFKI